MPETRNTVSIVTNPSSVTVFEDEIVTFRVTAEGTGLSYRWEYLPVGSDMWRDTVFTGSETPVLTVTSLISYNGQQFRCVVTDLDGHSAVSEPATLTVNALLKLSGDVLLEYLYNKKLPQLYRVADEDIDLPLKRFLTSLSRGGFHKALEDIEGILLLIDPNKIQEQFFPYLCESFGLQYFPDMDVTYQRRFLMNVGEIIRRRGTYSCIHYFTKVLTGLDSSLTYKEGVNPEDPNTLEVALLANTLEEFDKIEISEKVVMDYISSQLPYFITPVLVRRLNTVVIESTSYSPSVVQSHKTYNLIGGTR